jgi:endonuclease/exonuclease/phosphatase family metal-dependent hydrolase
MKTKSHLSICSLLIVLLGSVSGCVSSASSNTPTVELCVATYNVRYASATGANAWPQRRPLVNEVIRQMNPDLLGTQEGVHQQLQDIASDLPDYRWIGVGRDGGLRGEFMAIFYRHARLQPLSTNHFWLSDTPEVAGSATWGNRNRRMVTAVRFLDRPTGVEFDFYNTHFDHEVQVAREKSAELVRSRVATLSSNVPAILVGDFNADGGRNKAHQLLTEDGFFQDAWIKTAQRVGEGVSTFNSFKSVSTNGPRIDWILTRGPIEAKRVETVLLQPEGQWASDHFPVKADLVLRPAGR